VGGSPPRPHRRGRCAKAKGNFLSLSQIRNRACETWAWRSQLRFRACRLTTTDSSVPMLGAFGPVSIAARVDRDGILVPPQSDQTLHAIRSRGIRLRRELPVPVVDDDLSRMPSSSSFQHRFLACWVTQSWLGAAVQLASRARRVARWT